LGSCIRQKATFFGRVSSLVEPRGKRKEEERKRARIQQEIKKGVCGQGEVRRDSTTREAGSQWLMQTRMGGGKEKVLLFFQMR
jgi:hypothetical protein